MNCHQVLSGACNSGDQCFAVGSVEGIPFTVSICTGQGPSVRRQMGLVIEGLPRNAAELLEKQNLNNLSLMSIQSLRLATKHYLSCLSIGLTSFPPLVTVDKPIELKSLKANLHHSPKVNRM